jgi:hypothetical protein
MDLTPAEGIRAEHAGTPDVGPGGVVDCPLDRRIGTHGIAPAEFRAVAAAGAITFVARRNRLTGRTA